MRIVERQLKCLFYTSRCVLETERTLTNLYNQRPAWLDHAHRVLDEAVATAYGWPADLSDDEVLRRLLALNRERTGP